MYKSVKVEDVLGKSNFNKDYLDRTSLILSSKQNPTESTITSEEVEDTGWKDINRRIAESLQRVQPESTSEEITVPVTNSPKIHIDNVSEDLNTLLNMFHNAGINVRVTSGYRENARTKQGNKSHHSTGMAIDIVPEDGDFKSLATAIKSNQEISNFMKAKGFGIIDETSQEMLNKTGGTGAHFHIGPDKIAQNFWLS